MLKREVIITDDGSSSISIPELNENYHSTHGAIQESMHVYIKTGLETIRKNQISVFEMGFGTGLNAILSLLHSGNKKISYHAIEAYPVDSKIVTSLNYPRQLKLSEVHHEQFLAMHNGEYGKDISLSNKFEFQKEQIKLADFQTERRFDIIYFDAFAPNVQPELWTENIFQKMIAILNPDGILVTYCAKGQVRRNMIAAGFQVERFPGPPGKREILRAIKG